MTLGTLVLVALETEPVGSDSTSDFASLFAPQAEQHRALSHTAVPVAEGRWRNVLVSNEPGPSEAAPQAHFVLDVTRDADGQCIVEVRATDLWAGQLDAPADAPLPTRQTVTVAITGDLDRLAPPREVLVATLGLVQRIQRLCRIPADRVWLRSDIDPTCPEWGRAFAEQFHARLLDIRS